MEFKKPDFHYDYAPANEVAALRRYRDTKPGRAIPVKRSTRLLVATWNIANLGLQDRRPADYQLLAEMIAWFDIIALQEVNENLRGLEGIRCFLPGRYRALFSDAGGNHERMVFLYDSHKLTLLELAGEVGIPPKDQRYVRLPGVAGPFRGFDRNPYLAAFRARSFTFILANVHLYFGRESHTASMERRCLEAYAVGRWADLNAKDETAYCRNIIVLGDFNLPKVDPADPVYRALTRRGLHLPPHSSKMGSNLAGDRDYDQVAFFPAHTGTKFTQRMNVFDFDGAVFQPLWGDGNNQANFFAYLRYYLTDHRPLWAEFEI